MIEYKKGDIVIEDKSVWGKTKFVILNFHGNDYLPLVTAVQYQKPVMNRYKCNFDLREIRLVDAVKRPMKGLKNEMLLKLSKRGNSEAKREIQMRINNKIL